MVLRGAPTITDTERVRLRAAADPRIKDVFANGLANIQHIRFLAPPTIEKHDNIKNKWRDFVDYYTLEALHAEIVVGANMVPVHVVKAFALYLALGVRGQIRATAAHRTVVQYLSIFYSCWRRYANKEVDNQLRHQVLEYLSSVDFTSMEAPTKSVREKPIATALDLDNIIRFVLNDTTIFRTVRARIQFIGVNVLAALSGERPGTMIESTQYRRSNKALQWGDVGFIIVPNPDDPAHPFLAVSIRFRYVKAHRDDPKHYKTIYILLRPRGCRAECFVTILLYLAFRDNIFEHVASPDEILAPRFPPTAKYHLKIKDSVKGQSVFRGEELGEDGKWDTSETTALSATTHNVDLRKVCMAMGLLLCINMYWWRRLAANNFENNMTEAQRDAMLNHAPQVSTFAIYYQAKSLTNDVGGILFEGEEDSDRVKMAQTANSIERHEGAPTRLNVDQLAELEAEPELVAMRAQIAKYKKEVLDAITSIKSVDDSLPDSDELIASLHGVLRHKRAQHDQLRAKYQLIFNQEVRLRVKEARQQFFEGVPERQIRGEAAPAPLPMAIARPPLKDKTRESVQSHQPRIITSGGKENTITKTSFLANVEAIDPNARLCEILYRFPQDDLVAETEAAVNAYLGIPERPFAPCYPGESPTEDEKCPGCGVDCSRNAFRNSGSTTIGSHIHACLFAAQQKSVQERVEDAYVASACKWSGCKHENDIFAERPEFVEHVQSHILTLRLAPTSKVPVRACQWALNGGVCLEEHCDDWEKHFASVHGFNIRHKVELFYCGICHEWHVDELGDRLDWNGHQWDHYDTQYDQFAVRPETDVDLTPIGVKFTAERDAVSYAPGSGLGGGHPEFHGDIRLGVANPPPHCPWCVYNTMLDIEDRMRQFFSNRDFVRHLEKHIEEIEDQEDGHQCPVPSCGPTKFTLHEFTFHLIAFHRLPVCGGTNHTIVRRLNLPAPPAAVPVEAPSVDLAHLEDPPLTENASLTWEASAKAARKERKAAEAEAVPGYCLGCWKTYDDIGKHLTKNSGKCREKNRYHILINGAKSGPPQEWNLTGPPPAITFGRGTQPKTHVCLGKCRKRYLDIREHAKNPGNCKADRFCIAAKVPGQKATKGPPLSVADWIAEQDRGAGSDPEFVQGSSRPKRKRNSRVDSDEEDDDDEPGPSQKRPKVPEFRCNNCSKNFFDRFELASHFLYLKKNSRCKDKVFRARLLTSEDPTRVWSEAIPWATSLLNPENTMEDGEANKQA
ncbi:hypothetical protein R3P38DRAFT_1233044 [Favolaschia claudopus]|uniref:C2H2-type domain-containing protein n=1 Tax=Favolaschia claudopus TaxID=2862362 RepID=A0AAW0B441_9AGAR